MDVTWIDAMRPAEADVAGVVSLLEAVRLADHPWRPALTVPAFLGRLRHGWDGDPPLTGTIRDRRSRIIGVVEVTLPRRDNQHLALVAVYVDPAYRRLGVGRRLFGAGLDRASRDGRPVLLAEEVDQPAGDQFAAAMGFRRASEVVCRRQDVTGLDPDWLAREHATAAATAASYDLLRLPGPTPATLVAEMAWLTRAINDRPRDGIEVEDEVFPPERVSALETALTARGRRLYRVAARHRETRVLAGHTMVGVFAEQPAYAEQYDTSVLQAHRGHRLGLLLKLDMLRWLAEREPQVRALDTTNAATNTQMNRINDMLGYRELTRVTSWQRRL